MDALPDTPAEEARALSQQPLDATGAAYKSRDFAAYAPHFVVLGDVHSFGAVRLVSDLADLHDLFTEVLAFFDSIGLTALERDCVLAEFTDDETIKATHMSRLLSGTRLLAEPFAGFSLLRRADRVWKVASSQYATTDLRFTAALARPLKAQ